MDCRLFNAAILLLVHVRFLSAFPSGAPTSTCNTLLPMHDGTPPTDCGSDCPFSLALVSIDGQQVAGNTNKYRCGSLHKIQLRSNSAAFKGFAVQGRKSTPNFDSSAPFVGSFESGGPNWKQWKCSTPSATHTSGLDKYTVDLSWRAPFNSSTDPVTFWYSVVKVFDDFHVKIRGLELSPDQASCNQGLRMSCYTSIAGTVFTVNCDRNAAVASFQCAVDGAAPQPCVLPYKIDTTGYSVGRHQVTVIAKGLNGAQETLNSYFAVEPSLSARCNGSLSGTNLLSTTCTASSSIKSATCAIDNEPPKPCSFPFVSDVSALSPGDHFVAVSITGVNGLTVTVREAFSIEATLTANCNYSISGNSILSVTCTTSSPTSSALCSLDEETPQPCSFPYTRDVSILVVGPHQVSLTLVGVNGAKALNTQAFRINDQPLKCSSSQTASSLTVTCSDSELLNAVKCSIDSETPSTCTLPYKRDLTSLQTGEHTVTISAARSGSRTVQSVTLSFVTKATVSASCIASTSASNILLVSCRTSNPINRVQCSVDGETPQACSLPYTKDVSMLRVGSHEMVLTFFAVNNATTSYKIQFRVLEIQTLSCAASQTSTTLTVSCLNSNDLNSLQCSVDNEAPSSCTLPYTRDITKLQIGKHSFTISATFISTGSKLSTMLSFSKQASLTASCSSSTSAANILSVSCTTSSPTASVLCSVDGETPQSCTLPYTRDVSTLKSGSHQISFSFTGLNSATTSTTQTFTVYDTQSLSCSSSQTATTVKVSCSNSEDLSNVQCAVDGEMPSACTLPYVRDITSLQSGKHTATISATFISSGLTRSTTQSFNTQASLTASCSSSTSAANILSVSCTTSSPIASVLCSVDGETPQSCSLPYTRDVSMLPVGTHQIALSFVAVNGAKYSRTQIFSVSRVTQSLSCRLSQTATSIAVFCTNLEDLTNFYCSVDQESPAICTLPYTRNTTGLPTGGHTVNILATTISTRTSRSTTLSFNTQASLTLACSASFGTPNVLTVSCFPNNPVTKVTCEFDGVPTSCYLSFTRDVSSLSVGTHTVKIMAFGYNGDYGSAVLTYDVTNTLVLNCKSSILNSVLTTSCSSNTQIANSLCSVDREIARPCSIPYVRNVSMLGAGEHTVTISATAANGAEGRSTAAFTIQPALSLVCANEANGAILVVRCNSSSQVQSFQCSLDGGAPLPCTIPFIRDITSLSPGKHTSNVYAVDTKGGLAVSTTDFSISDILARCSASVVNYQLSVTCTLNAPNTAAMCSINNERPQSCSLPYTRAVDFLPSGVHTATVSISATNRIPTIVTIPFEISTPDDLNAPLTVRFVNDSPIVKPDRTITVFVRANKPTDAMYCQALGTTLGTVDCSNGVATFNNVPAGDIIIKVIAQAPYEESVISSSITVPKTTSDCSPYLINDMVTTSGNTVIVRFASTGQPRGFLCTSDGYKKPCTSPYEMPNVKYGKHYILINPEGCEGKSTFKGFYFYTYNN